MNTFKNEIFNSGNDYPTFTLASGKPTESQFFSEDVCDRGTFSATKQQSNSVTFRLTFFKSVVIEGCIIKPEIRTCSLNQFYGTLFS